MPAMLVNFDSVEEEWFPSFRGGQGIVKAKIVLLNGMKVIISRIPEGSSIGMHAHETSSEVCFVVEGEGIAYIDGKAENLTPGTCHICEKGSSHMIINIGSQDLVLNTVVKE